MIRQVKQLFLLGYDNHFREVGNISNESKKELDIVVVGELNADVILSGLPGLPEMGRCKLARNMEFTLGSASAIFAANISRLGRNVGFIGKIGDDYLGEFVRGSLEKAGVDCSRINRDGRAKTGICVSLSFPEDYAQASYPGVRELMTVRDVDFDYLETAKHLHLSSYYLQTGMIDGCVELFRNAREKGLTTSLDPDSDAAGIWHSSIFEVLPYVDIFMPNAYEARSITGTGQLRAALEKLSASVPIVVIKQGRDGAMATNGTITLEAPAFQAEVIDTTGAGDSFNAGFIYQFLNQASLEKCLAWGNACAAISTTSCGGTTGFPEKEGVEEFLRSRKEEHHRGINYMKG